MFKELLVKFIGRIGRMTKVHETESTITKSEEALHHVQNGRIEKEHHEKSENLVCTDDAEKPKHQRVKHFRYAVLLGYQGKNYYGMQVQKGHGHANSPTIEGHLLDALLKNKWITQAQYDKPFSFYFQRAARTDRAVSAVRQLCSMNLPRMDDVNLVGAGKLNEHLPDDIRVFGIRRTTANFHSQKNCDARTYSYTLPTFAFAKPTELTDSKFRITPETVTDVNQVLDIYKGTHNFFNYTSRKSFEDRSCNRYIILFECGQPFLFRDEIRNEDVEFVTIVVKGQSFILHQIRKMIGMTISVVRELQLKSAIQRSFEGKRMDVPKAPGLGLLLERLHFEKYDKTFGCQQHDPLSNWGESIEKTVEEMKMEYITKDIMETEIREQSMLRWLSDLHLHDYSIDPEREEVEKRTFVADAAATVKAALEEQQKVEADVTETKAVVSADPSSTFVKEEEKDTFTF